MVVPVLAFVL